MSETKCSTCKYWKKLNNTPESLGMCEWFNSNRVTDMPFSTCADDSYFFVGVDGFVVPLNHMVPFLPTRQDAKPMSETKPGMSSWTEDDIRRIVQDVLRGNERMNMERMLAAIGYKIVEPQDTNEGQEGQDDTQAGSADSVTAD